MELVRILPGKNAGLQGAEYATAMETRRVI